MINNIKPKLEKYDTAILMTIKNHKIKLKYDYLNEYTEFGFSGKNSILNDYLELTYIYADSRLIPLTSIRIEYITQALIEIYFILEPNKLKDLLLELNNKSNYSSNSISENIFEEIYGRLETLTMLDKNGNELFELDYLLVLTN